MPDECSNSNSPASNIPSSSQTTYLLVAQHYARIAMFKKLKDAAAAIHELARPWCKTCGRHAFRHHHCSLCAKITATNRFAELTENLNTHHIRDEEVTHAQWICNECFCLRARAKCCKTGQVFIASENRMDDFDGSKMRDNLCPYHPDSQLEGALSQEGFLLIEVEHDALQERIANWAGGTKHETLPAYRIAKEIGLVRCESHCDDPGRVEHFLQWNAAQVGGNGFIKLFWDKHIEHHEEEYVAGYSHKGNPYYRTRHYTTQYYTGHAVAVVAEPLEPKRPNKTRPNFK